MRSCDPPHEERHGDCEEGVLDELEVADEVVLEEGIVDRRRAKRLEGEPEEQRKPGNPEDPRRPQPARPKAYGKDEGRDDDDEHCEVREADVDRRRAELDRELRLVLLVEEEKGDGDREEDRSDGVAVDRDREGFALGR